ncbi:MAG TPA: site-specific DNA-methyltransferase [Candidatus Binatus sp.]|nr:site-specific DNA-methyltransferase [Candidatus Binatus sp.]
MRVASVRLDLRMDTIHRVVFGDSRSMKEIADESIHLMVTSPPYYNAPFDYPGLFKDYDEFHRLMRTIADELYRVLAPGRIACFVTDDMLVDGVRYPVVADITRIMLKAGFTYRDRIMWVKPKGYIRISRRSGVLLQHPYPMYFYPDNIQETILVFQKGKFDYAYTRGLPKKRLEKSRVSVRDYNEHGWHLTVWNITNVLPFKGRAEEGIAAFPDEIPRRLVKLYSFTGETVLDPFAGSGTTLRVAKELGRNSWGYELDLELKNTIRTKINDADGKGKVVFKQRNDARRLRSKFRRVVRRRRSVAVAAVT